MGRALDWRWVGAIVALGAVLSLGGCGGDSATSREFEPARIDRFDTGIAWGSIERQVEIGQRPAGSPQLRRLWL